MMPPQAERDAISAELEALRAEQPEAVRGGLEPALLAGVAAHHAGCLPAWKSLIERCFQRGDAHAPHFESRLCNKEVLCQVQQADGVRVCIRV